MIAIYSETDADSTAAAYLLKIHFKQTMELIIAEEDSFTIDDYYDNELVFVLTNLGERSMRSLAKYASHIIFISNNPFAFSVKDSIVEFQKPKFTFLLGDDSSISFMTRIWLKENVIQTFDKSRVSMLRYPVNNFEIVDMKDERFVFYYFNSPSWATVLDTGVRKDTINKKGTNAYYLANAIKEKDEDLIEFLEYTPENAISKPLNTIITMQKEREKVGK